MKAACPFCKAKETDIRGEGCCNCDHSGMVPIGEAYIFKNAEQAKNHNPEIGYIDLLYNRQHGMPDNYQPF